MTSEHTAEPSTADATESADDGIRRIVTRLARPHRSGGRVIERAAILAEGADFDAVIAWITAHGGTPEMAAPPKASRGLHASRQSASMADPVPLRFILPAGALR